MTERALTDDERDRLLPLLDETEIPVRVTSDLTTLPEIEVPVAGEAVGRWPRERGVLLTESCFETYTDDELLGLLAHELGHHDGYHGLVLGVGELCGSVIAIAILLGLTWLGIVGNVVVDQWVRAGLNALAASGFGFLFLLGTAAISRRFEFAADRRGADLLGSTKPLEAWFERGMHADYGSWWAEKCFPYPHPADRLAALREDSVQ